LVTFEKRADMEDAATIGEIRSRLAEAGARWVPLRYHKRPKWPATAADIAAGFVRCVAEGRRGRASIVHARTFVAGPIGLAAARTLGARFVYHNEGFYPDEQVDAGVWRAESFPHWMARRLERRLYESADGIVTLSERARLEVSSIRGVKDAGTPVIVVPSAVDVARFHRPGRRPWSTAEPLRVAYIGSVGGRYPLNAMARFVAQLREVVPKLSFLVLSQTDRATVERGLREAGLDPSLWQIEAIRHEQVPERLVECHVGLSFRLTGLSGRGCSPTKTGEYWASGLPVVTSAGVGDNDDVVLRERVGVVVSDDSPMAYRNAAAQLVELMRDAALAERCRRAAETHYGLEGAVKRQEALYQLMLDRRK
jgi:glycosyltransferase involved in cell wall biosynthesis